jgi:hypothetical protein
MEKPDMELWLELAKDDDIMCRLLKGTILWGDVPDDVFTTVEMTSGVEHRTETGEEETEDGSSFFEAWTATVKN